MAQAIDMHCDTIMKLYREKKEGKPYSLRENDGQVDLMKLRKGNYLTQNFAMFVYMDGTTDPYHTCHEMMDVFDAELSANSDMVMQVRNAQDILRARASGKVGALLTIEEGGVCRGSLSALQEFYDQGARMMTLTWNFENEIGYPAALAAASADGASMGLKPFGVELVQKMEELGMIIDVSHLSDAGFYDVLKYTKAPFVASHSDARALCPHQRNLTDEMIRALAERGGVIGLNYCASFLAQQQRDAMATIEQIAAHAKHIAKVGGIGCLGLGSDFDGIGNPVEMQDASGMIRLSDGLRKAGFHESEVDAIFSGNVMRIYEEILR